MWLKEQFINELNDGCMMLEIICQLIINFGYELSYKSTRISMGMKSGGPESSNSNYQQFKGKQRM